MAEHDGERMRETIEALMSEHITQETYEQWRREASQEVREKLEEGETGVSLAEVQRLVTRRVLLHLAERTSGAVSDSFRAVASEYRKREDD